MDQFDRFSKPSQSGCWCQEQRAANADDKGAQEHGNNSSCAHSRLLQILSTLGYTLMMLGSAPGRLLESEKNITSFQGNSSGSGR